MMSRSTAVIICKILSCFYFQPFVDVNQSIHKCFPTRIYAIAGPLSAGVVALVLIGHYHNLLNQSWLLFFISICCSFWFLSLKILKV